MTPEIDDRVTELEQLLGEVMARLLFVMQTMRVSITEFSATLGADGKPIPIGQRQGSLLDFYTDAQKQKELIHATEK